MRWLYAIVIAGCGGPGSRTIESSPPVTEASAEHRAAVRASDAPCVDAALVVEAGGERGMVCPDDAAARHLVVVDLQDAWTPRLFAPQPDGTAPGYRATYLALAAEHDAAGKPVDPDDALGELYGVLPSLAIVRERLADDARHRCNDFIDNSAIPLLDRGYAEDYKDLVKMYDLTRVALEQQLERERDRRGVLDLPALAGIKDLAPVYERWAKLDVQHRGIVAAQNHYVCEGWLAADDADGAMTWRTGNATEMFQRRNFLMPNQRLDPETREALMLDSGELDFRLALRVLRERVVDATGLVEDGTAGAGPQPILGRMLDPAEMRAARGNEQPLPGAAPDLIAAATEAAARALGWLGPAEARAFLERHPGGLRVALALPVPPAYHAPHMQLRAAIDRGDVWYDEVPIPRLIRHRPTLVLYADDAAAPGGQRALIRWPTTIGGWADQRLEDGGVVQRWKESDVGPRMWRDLFAAPTWLPPKTTPDRDLVKNLWNGHWGLKTEIMGPGAHAAYGMTLLVHHEVIKLRDGGERYDDNGIGTHGSASVTSIVNGTSHGCHRLYNQLAVRLADFLLRHRTHEVRGEQPEIYRRVVARKDERFVAKITTRGFLYELTPPVPVNVLKGNIRSDRKVPPRDAAPARPD
ncbi:MAG TPA: L,D-transpeptidase [Kofleriaceae bacterium]|nr:L,D-transpeptidase [Kofleriaceae bacterium]